MTHISAVKSLAKPVWESYKPAPGDEKPTPRAGHVLVTNGDRIILFVLSLSSFPLVITLCRFGGADGQSLYNDTWLFDVSTQKWTELRCTGRIPSPRYCLSASLVDDVMYVFGGRDIDGAYLGDLTAFQLSSK